MSGEVVNLRRARKQRARAEARETGAQNAARSGATATERAQTAAREALTRRTLDGARVTRRPEGDGEGS